MSFTIRTFRNSDTPQLCTVWNRHTQVFATDSTMSAQSFELSVVGKPYFDAGGLFVAECGENIVGFAHLGFAPQADMADASLRQAVLSATAVIPCDDDDMIAAALLREIENYALRAGASTIESMSMLPLAPFYVGVGPGDSARGVAASDTRLNRWLANAKFCPRITTSVWELDLVDFHPPMDRQQIHIRRSAHVDRRLDEPIYPWRLACQMGHTEQISFELIMRSGNAVICRALMWTIEQSLIPSGRQIARLWWPQSLPTDLLDHYTFLLSEAFRQLALDRFESIRTITIMDDPASNVLDRLGFHQGDVGHIHEKQVSGDNE